MIKKTIAPTVLCLLLAGLVSCSQEDWRDSSLTPERRAELLLGQMTLEEKVGQMCQYVAPCYVEPGKGSAHKNIDATDTNLGDKNLADKVRRGEVGAFLHVMTSDEAVALQKMARRSRLGIPLLLGIDALHGNALISGCTVYPTNINMASSFNPEMMERIGAETAQEMRQRGLFWTFAPNLDIARDARWGRMGETFGEDAYLTSEMGKYAIWGLQGRDGKYSGDHVVACAKHLIAGGEPAGGLNAAPMDISERKLRELYLPPFVAAVQEAKVGTVMPAHNEINGIPCHGNKWLLNDLLRDELGFDGFVVSDWMDIERLHSMHHWAADSTEAFVLSVESGVDMHMQGDKYFEAVVAAVKSGRLPERRIDRAAGKILAVKFALGLFEQPVPEIPAVLTGAQEHRATALEAARQGLVLLENDGTLPLKSPRRVFVAGPNADSQTILGDWAVPQDDADVITVLEGLKEALPETAIDAMTFGGMISNVDEKGIGQARRRAALADVNIVVVGDNSQRYSAFGRTCGENCDRDNLDLPGLQEQLLEAVVASGKPTVVVVMSGRALSLGWAKDNANAVLNVWEPGQTGGQAIAEVLTGQVNPSGKLPVTIPRNVGQVQTVYNYKHSQYSRQFATSVTGALWPFGYGLSYSDFTYSDASLSKSEISPDESLTARVTLTNCGPYDGDEVVQLYIRDEYASVTRPVKELKAFRRVSLKNGESTEVEFGITPKMLQCWGASEKWAVEPGDFTVLIGSSSADSDLIPLTLTVK